MSRRCLEREHATSCALWTTYWARGTVYAIGRLRRPRSVDQTTNLTWFATHDARRLLASAVQTHLTGGATFVACAAIERVVLQIDERTVATRELRAGCHRHPHRCRPEFHNYRSVLRQRQHEARCALRTRSRAAPRTSIDVSVSSTSRVRAYVCQLAAERVDLQLVLLRRRKTALSRPYDVNPICGPTVMQFLTNKLHHRISPTLASTTVARASRSTPTR